MESINDIVRMIREDMPQKMEGFKNGELFVLDTAMFADSIEAAIEAYNQEVVNLLKSAINKAKHFIEAHELRGGVV